MGIGSIIIAICVVAGAISLLLGPFLLSDYMRLNKQLKESMHQQGHIDDAIDKAFREKDFRRIRTDVRVYEYNQNPSIIIVSADKRWDFIDRGKSEFHTTAPELGADSILSLAKLMKDKTRYHMADDSDN